MKKILFSLLAFIILTAVIGYLVTTYRDTPPDTSQQAVTETPTESSQTNPELTVLATGLDTPWGIAFLPTGGMLVTERSGTVRLIDGNGELQSDPVGKITAAREIGEGGLLGIALDPDFVSTNYVYLYYTYNAAGANTMNRVVRMTLQNNTLTNERMILDRIPGASNHNGGRIIFGPDRNLYIGTGDAQEPSEAQDTRSLAGKILRITRDGKAAPGNPFANPVYSYGHRNVQGLAFDTERRLWATEHGRSGVSSGLDEVNLIESGKNYGWPEIEGNETETGMVTPVANSGSGTTWAPAGAAVIEDSLFFGGLRGNAVYEGILTNNSLSNIVEHFTTYGRIREVTVGPDGYLYFTTSNLDGRGRPQDGDDKIFRIDPKQLRSSS